MKSVCLVTVTTEDFLPGTVVTVGSFLEHHPRFDGDVVIVHDGLSDETCESLQALFDRVRFEPVGPELRERLARLHAAHPELDAHMRAQLLSLEAFRLAGYRKTLLCDSDLLFRGSVGELFGAHEALLGGGDNPFLHGGCRDAATFARLTGAAQAGAAGALERTFNAGFLLIDAELVNEAVYSGLLDTLSARAGQALPTGHTDQFVYNLYFAGRQTLIGSTYNYLLRSAAAIRAREGLRAIDAKVLHFNLPAKPWMPRAMLRWAAGPVAPAGAGPGPLFKLWYDAWLDSLAGAHLRTALRDHRTRPAERRAP